MKIISLEDNLRLVKDKTVFLRLDLNVPIKNGKIIDDYKLESSLKTIKILLDLDCKIIIATHLGEPSIGSSARRVDEWSVAPIARLLAKKIGLSVKLLPLSWSVIKSSVKKMKNGDILMLENIRLFKGEVDNDDSLAFKLSSLAQVYVNDAFAVSHRAHASVAKIKDYLPALAGPLLTNEVKKISTVSQSKKPLILIMGGAKLSTKFELFKKMSSRSAFVLVGGGLANTFLKFKGMEIGKSLFDNKGLVELKKINIKNVIYPIDVAIKCKGLRVNKDIDQIKPNDIILDLGPKTVKLYKTYIKKANSLIWNGPLGVFEKRGFDFSTKEISKTVASITKRGAFTLIGGGETLAALKNSHKSFSWVSTGGGATLAFLSDANLPGLKKLIKN